MTAWVGSEATAGLGKLALGRVDALPEPVATQVVTKTTVLRAGVEFNRVAGLQENPYRNVYVAGTNVPENHPDVRMRQDIFLGLSQYVYNRSSVKLDYRYYSDDWGVSSHMIGIKLNQYVNEEFIFRYRYRYYAQLPSEFYRDEYLEAGGVNGYQTSDYRMGDFGAHLFGGQVHLYVDAEDDAAETLARNLPSSACGDYGRPFGEIFKAAGYDFYKIDPMLFSPARVTVSSVRTGRSFHAGSTDPGLLQESFGRDWG